jgi:CubicO group peptidase (beta-lactamase class C family)
MKRPLHRLAVPQPFALVVALLVFAISGLGPVAQATTVTAGQTGVAPLPLTGDRRAEFEAFVATSLVKMGVPGASVAVVQDGEVVYLQGFGVRELGGSEPVTPDTLNRLRHQVDDDDDDRHPGRRWPAGVGDTGG